ncbi:MAG: FeoA family protein [Thermoguttaceae bacterium]
MPKSIPVSRLQAGQAAQISRIVGRADDVHRLEEFGLRKGTEVVMFRPGNPCILRMAGNKICLRANDLLSVFVTLTAAPC